MAARTRETKRLIIAALNRLGRAGPLAVAHEMGPEWTEPSKYSIVRQLMGSMARNHLLIRAGRGKYQVSGSLRWRGLDAADEMEKAIEGFLRDRGGVARTGDIHEAMTNRQLDGPERNYDHRRITLLLKDSVRFRQDFGRGWWNLPMDQLEGLPLLGRWADYLIQSRWDEWGECGSFETWEDMRDDLFSRVGQAFADARAGQQASEVAANADIASALAEMVAQAPTARQLAVEALRDQVTVEANAEGVADQFAIMGEVVRRMEGDLGEHLYAEFERGNVELHVAAPVEFYRACALIFGVCPARLSRGEVAPIHETRFAPTTYF